MMLHIHTKESMLIFLCNKRKVKNVEPWQILLLLGIVVLLYANVFLKKDASQTSSMKNISDQLEQTFETFAYEMEEENKQIMKHILQLKQEYEVKTRQLTERIEALEHANHQTKQQDYSIRSRYSELLSHHKEGKSVDWISKKTGIPNGELQLILKLAEQEEARNA